MIVITGASDGLGLAVAKLYQTDGKKVVNVSRRASKYADVNILKSLREGKDIAAAAKEIAAIDEPLEAIINCAGVFSKEPLGQITEEETKRLMSTNVKGPMLLASNLMNRITQDGTDIVNVSSTAGLKGNPGEAVYNASKWALRGFSANLQAELRNTPSRVISFCPGGFKTKLFEKATGTDNTGDGSEWMKVEDVALCLKQTLDLPKNMEVSEIVINRKVTK